MKLSKGLLWGWMLFCLAASQPLFALGNQVIELNDGSTISGKVVSMRDGVYTIESSSLSRLQLDASAVRTIRASGSGGGGAGLMAGDAQLGALQQRMVGNPEVMGQVMALQNDPQVQQLLADPEILRAVQSGDLNALGQNPKVLELLQNSRVQAIHREMLGR